MAFQTMLYHSGMAGAPSATLNAAGALITVLDACLADGFNVRTVTGITRSGSEATAAIDGTVPWEIGAVMESSGWDQAAYNGRFKVKAKTTGSVTFDVVGTPTSPGTGTGSMKTPSAGWTKADLGTNIRSYRQAGGGFYQQVEDNNPYADVNVSVRVRMAAGLTALDTASEMGDQRKVQKASPGWVVVADPYTCYVIMGGANVLHFGRFASFNTSDAYNYFTTRGETGEASSGVAVNGRTFPRQCYTNDLGPTYSLPGVSLLRGNSQLAGAVNGHCLESVAPLQPSIVINRWQAVGSPNAADGAIPLMPLFMVEWGVTTVLRGEFRGMYWPLCTLDAGQFSSNVAVLDDLVIMGAVRRVVMCRFGPAGNAQIAFDLGDWA